VSLGGGEDDIGFYEAKFSIGVLQLNGNNCWDLPAAAIDSGRLIAMSSSVSTKDGWATNPAPRFPSFKNRITY
jgi:hypothetical protein